MFAKNSEKDIQNRLAVLHVLEKYTKPIERDVLINFFLVSNMYTFLEINDIINTLKENNLIVEDNNILALSDNGIVVHSFFIDKLPYDKQRQIEEFMSETSIFDEEFHSMVKENDKELIIMIAQGKKIALDMKISKELLSDINNKNLPSKTFYEEIVEIVKKHLIQNEL